MYQKMTLPMMVLTMNMYRVYVNILKRITAKYSLYVHRLHLNTPGKLGGNWAWRAAAGFESKTLAKTIADECSVYCRV